MEDWLSQLEMAWNDEAVVSNNNLNEQYDDQNQELASFLGEDFSFLPEKTTSIHTLLNYCTSSEVPTNLSSSDQPLNAHHDNQQLVIIPQISEHNRKYDDSSTITPIITSSLEAVAQDQNPKISHKDARIIIDERVTKSERKRRRGSPEQVYCHIIAERKRREIMSQRFITLSAMVPGLKKVDKTSILEEAIRYLAEMKKKVKALEESKFKKNVGAMMVKRTRQLNLEGNDNVTDSSTLSSIDDPVTGNSDGILPKIVAKTYDKTLFLKIWCVKRKGVWTKIYQEVENFRMMRILNCNNMAAFDDSALDISIIAEMETGHGYDKHVHDLVQTLHSALRRL